MEDRKLTENILLKTSFRGFDKKTVMDFIEKLQAENEELRRSVNALQNENQKLSEQLDMLERVSEYSQNAESDLEYDSFITVEDIGMTPELLQLEREANDEYEILETVQTAKKVSRKPVLKAKKSSAKVKVYKK